MLNVILIVLILVSLIYGIVNTYIYYVFEKRDALAGSSFATRKNYTHKENVELWTRRAKNIKIRHLTKSVYTYAVNGKSYVFRKEFYTKPGETPRTIGIKYIKKYPFIAVSTEIRDSGDSLKFILNAIVSFLIAVTLIICIAL